jgi:formylglycine-generating enzyme required for sulfatase activity
MPAKRPQSRRKTDRNSRVAAANQAFGRLLRHHVLVLGTRPAGLQHQRWTTQEFAGRLPGRGEEDHASERNVTYWFAGEHLPDKEFAFPAILRALFGPNAADGGEDRQALRGAYDAARRAADVAALEAEPRLANGYIAGDAGSRIGFNTAPAADDVAAAADPGFEADHSIVSEMARDFAQSVAQDRSNLLAAHYPQLRRAAERFAEAMAHPAADLPNWLPRAYPACLMLAAAYDLDRRYRQDRGAGEPLREAMQSDLGVLLELAVPLLLTLPSVQRKDRTLRAFRGEAAVQDSREVAQRMRARGDVTPEADDILRDLLDAALAGGAQGAKADDQLLSTIVNTLLFGGAGILRPARELDAGLVERLRALFREAREPIERLIAGESLPVQAALRHALATVAASRRDQETPWPPRTPFVQWRDPLPGLPEDAWPDMVTLPPGAFLMGAPEDEEGTDDDERPQRQVTLTAPVAIGRCAVTFAQWDAAVAAGFAPASGNARPADAGWGRGGQPVINVSWHDAQDYCAWLNARLGLRPGTYRLLSEAEYEYACRAGTRWPFSFGATLSTAQANYKGNSTYGPGRKGEFRQRTVPVGSLPANDWGLYEMHGNVWQWVEDAYGPYPDRPTDAGPVQHADAASRVLRGGSWLINPRYLRSAHRFGHRPDDRNNDFGFRVARTLG